MPTILLSAGDASGDAHAASLVRVLGERIPYARFVGLGGAKMEAAGVELLADARALAVGGIVELGGSSWRIARAWRAMVKGLKRLQPDLVILVDSGGFNLPLARRIRQVTNARVLYFVAPQVWAWRAGRLSKLVDRSDRIAVLFPFERDFYETHGVKVDYVGNPLLDEPVATPTSSQARVKARRDLGLDEKRATILLLPGSRRNEVERHLPIQIAALAALLKRRPDLANLQAIVGLAPSIDGEWIRDRLRTLPEGIEVRLEEGGLRLIDAADVALTKPGTNTVELMLRGRPMVVMGSVNPLTASMVRRGLKVRWLSMPNLIAGEQIVPELFQADATPDRIAEELASLFLNDARCPGLSPVAAEQMMALSLARDRLGPAGAIERVADIVEELLGKDA
jgi:lipid-A-disaccharide synthase